jgi:hypothetical protein
MERAVGIIGGSMRISVPCVKSAKNYCSLLVLACGIIVIKSFGAT